MCRPGPELPVLAGEGLDRGYYVRPTVFAGVTPDMATTREEIFGTRSASAT
jgi:acyl-CoA reductase-like NAD-dependent aldehyde dehydrogenase